MHIKVIATRESGKNSFYSSYFPEEQQINQKLYRHYWLYIEVHILNVVVNTFFFNVMQKFKSWPCLRRLFAIYNNLWTTQTREIWCHKPAAKRREELKDFCFRCRTKGNYLCKYIHIYSYIYSYIWKCIYPFKSSKSSSYVHVAFCSQKSLKGK